jgi:peptidoglycan LD-endopeptidase LytH
MTNLKILFIFFVLILSFSSCSQQGVGKLFQRKSLYEEYLDKLKKVEINKTALGSEWIRAGESALRDSIEVEIPFRETGYFSTKTVRAESFRFLAKEGQRIEVTTIWNSKTSGQLFLDVFKVDKSEVFHLIAADSTLTLSFEIENDGEYLLRLQPELLRGGKFILEIQSKPVLAFPIPGKDSRAIGSFFGVDRDGGKRKHEGVDIFASKKTPVIAVVNGRVSRAGTNQLGGKVVFLNDFKRRNSYYYAHLDSQFVSAGELVNVGDTLGLIGNTGNARYTPAHLHFSVYTWMRGAIDPLPFIQEQRKNIEPDAGQIKYLNQLSVTKGRRTELFGGQGVRPVAKTILGKNTVVEIIGLSGKYYRIKLPDRTEGYIKTTNLSELNVLTTAISKNRTLQVIDSYSEDEAIISTIPSGQKFSVLGEYKNKLFVHYKELEGWVDKSLL